MNLNKLSKDELEELGRENGVELDKRKGKKSLISELREVVGDTKKSSAPEWIGRQLAKNGAVVIIEDIVEAEALKQSTEGAKYLERVKGGYAILSAE